MVSLFGCCAPVLRVRACFAVFLFSLRNGCSPHVCLLLLRFRLLENLGKTSSSLDDLLSHCHTAIVFSTPLRFKADFRVCFKWPRCIFCSKKTRFPCEGCRQVRFCHSRPSSAYFFCSAPKKNHIFFDFQHLKRFKDKNRVLTRPLQ